VHLRLQHPAGPTPSTPPLRRRPWPPVGKTTEVVLGEEAPPASHQRSPRSARTSGDSRNSGPADLEYGILPRADHQPPDHDHARSLFAAMMVLLCVIDGAVACLHMSG
jgi:hypothetical protein